MITSTPIARWAWGREAGSDDGIAECLRSALGVVGVLVRHGLVEGEPLLEVTVKEFGSPDSFLFRSDVRVDGRRPVEEGERLAASVKDELRPGKPGSVNVAVTCAGTRREGDDWRREDRMFTLGVSVMSGYFTAHLETFSDAWMAYDLQGREQAAVYAANAPRLRSALEEISSLVGEEVDPDDPTWFGVPTEWGVENRFEDDGSASDVWRSFELPYRKRVFQFDPKFGRAYRRTAAGEIGYVEVVGGNGILGYLWVSDAEGAASYEPCDAAGDDAFESGVLWLKVLDEAKKSGLVPSQALAAASRLTEEPGRGRIALETWRTAPDLASLRELAERDE